MDFMKEQLQIPESHYSYTVHRRQFWWQIFLPVSLAIVLIIVVAALLSISALNGSGDSVRWAAISTIWLLIPVMFFGLLLLAALVGIVYLLARTLGATPRYFSLALYYINRASSAIKNFSSSAARPFIFIDSLGASLKAIFGRN
jgi:uncharacterized membrane protein YhaH (DUF805 family)